MLKELLDMLTAAMSLWTQFSLWFDVFVAGAFGWLDLFGIVP
jgi:hypothetical protein